MNLQRVGKAKFSAGMYPANMSSCKITEQFVAAVSGHPRWLQDDRRHYCAYCGVKTRQWTTNKDGPAPNDAVSRDHVIPKKTGGKLLIPACIECNRAKGASSMEEFIHSERFRVVRATPNQQQWPMEQLWLAHAAAALQICFQTTAKDVVASAERAA